MEKNVMGLCPQCVHMSTAVWYENGKQLMLNYKILAEVPTAGLKGNCHDCSGYDSLHGWKLTFIQFGDCLPFPTLHCSLRLWQNTRIVLATLHPTMLPVRGKCGNNVACYADTRNISGDFQKHLLCLPQMLRQNKSTFGKHDHVSNVATTMCPHFAGPFPSLSVSFT